MPSMTKVKGGYNVYNKVTKKKKFVKLKKQAEQMVSKGYKNEYKTKTSTGKVNFDYGGKLFSSEAWKA